MKNYNCYDKNIINLGLNYELKNYYDNDNINEINEFFINQSKENKITMFYKINNPKENIRLFGEKFFNNNKENCRMVIDFVEMPLLQFYQPKQKENILKVNLELKTNISDLSYMFCGCTSLTSIPDFYNLNITKVTNISHMFSECSSLEVLPDISIWNTNNIIDMSYLFSECSSLKDMPDISKWKTNKVINMSHIFHSCSSLKLLPDISKWNTNNVTDISYIFANCSSLEKMPDISKWNTNKIIDISYIFFECCSLRKISDISKWKTNNVINMSYIFYNCFSLEELPDISEWNTENVKNMKAMFSYTTSLQKLPNIGNWNTKSVENISNMFYGCSSIKYLPDISTWCLDNVINISYLFCKCSSLENLDDISKWKTDKVTDMSYAFYGCKSLTSIPDISFWETCNVKNMSYMFFDCSSLKYFPYISKWNTRNVTNMSHMFYNCFSLLTLDDISKWNTDKLTDITMIFYNCPLISPFPDISKWKCNQNQNQNQENNEDNNNNNVEINNKINEFKMNNEYKIEVKGPISNDNLKFIPQIELKFNNVDNFDKDLMDKIKKEIKDLIKTDNFSIIQFKKGSLTVAITLQYLVLREIKKTKKLNETFFTNINREVEEFAEKVKDHQFISLGKTKPDYVDKEIINITEENNRKEIGRKILEIGANKKDDEINIIEFSKNIEMEDLERYIDTISLEADEQEINLKRFIQNAEEFNKVFDKEIEVAFKNSIFEYKIIHIFQVDKENSQFLTGKNNCNNRITKLFFHGTKVDAVTGILSNQFFDAQTHIFGEGVYFTDILDYAWYYAGEVPRANFNKIPKVGETFTCVASEIYYDSTKLETVYDCRTKDIPVQKNGIRCAFANYRSKILTQMELDEYKNKFVGNEYLITDKSQIMPIYGVTFKRVEYLVIWRDYNFDESNPNNYSEDLFNEIQEFHRKIKKFISREIDSKVYYIENSEEALNLVKRKKYNKIIIITNGNNNGREFIIKAREIIGSNAIAAVTAVNVSGHIHWVKQMENVLLLNGLDFHEKFFNCIKYNDINKYEELREEIINHYNNQIDFDLREPTDNLFIFPKFKEKGHFKQLDFGRNDDNLNDDDNDDDNEINFEEMDLFFRLLLLNQLMELMELNNFEENN